MKRLNVVDEAHRAMGEVAEMRKKFHDKQITTEEAKQSIGYFNASSRTIGMAINAEKWYKVKQGHKINQ